MSHSPGVNADPHLVVALAAERGVGQHLDGPQHLAALTRQAGGLRPLNVGLQRPVALPHAQFQLRINTAEQTT